MLKPKVIGYVGTSTSDTKTIRTYKGTVIEEARDPQSMKNRYPVKLCPRRGWVKDEKPKCSDE